MKKKLNIDAIQSDLRGGSAFFPEYTRSVSPPPTSSSATLPDTIQSISESTPLASDHLTPKTPSVHSTKDDRISTNVQGVPPPVPRAVRGTVPPPLSLIPKVKRAMKQRQPFDIYEDQYICLKQIADAERNFTNGRGMSQMVRQATGVYLKDNSSFSKK